MICLVETSYIIKVRFGGCIDCIFGRLEFRLSCLWVYQLGRALMHYFFYTGMAIALWATFASLVSEVSHMPPFFILAITLGIGGCLSIAQYRQWQLSWRVLLFGVAGIFGYHFLLIMAFRLAPPVEANLINYLWPLLIVLLSPIILPGFRLSWTHWLGGAFGFIGVVVLVGDWRTLHFNGADFLGYILALAAALVWASYSLVSKRLESMSTATVGLFCLLSGAIALLMHWGFETSVTLSSGDWWRLLALGLGPMGMAFYCWDAGLKKGDPRIIGTLSYLTPLLSTLLLLVISQRGFEWPVFIALALIVGGAFVSSYRLSR